MKSIVILGSTGSIGTNTLDIVERFRDEFRVVGLTAGNNDEMLAEQIRRFRPQVVVSIFPGQPHPNHGQHQAAGVTAHEAFPPSEGRFTILFAPTFRGETARNATYDLGLLDWAALHALCVEKDAVMIVRTLKNVLP